MEPRNFPEDPMSNQSPDVRLGFAPIRPDITAQKARIFAGLLCNKSFSDTFGNHGEYEVRTTLETHHHWRYRCRVFCNGQEMKRAFFPLDIDRTRDIRRHTSITEEMRLAFADEAVEGHFAISAAVQEYLLMASIYAVSPSHRSPLNRVGLVILYVRRLSRPLGSCGINTPSLCGQPRPNR